MARDCSVVLAQTNPALGDLSRNLDDHVRRAAAAAERGGELVVFPELSLTGYFLKDQSAEVALPLDAPELDPLRELSTRISIVAGFVERADDGRLYNTTALFEDGAIAGTHRKVHLVGYGMFEELRDLAAGDSFAPVESRHGRLGFLTCEDAWHLGGTYLHFTAGVDAIVVVSAGPARGVESPGPGFASSRTWTTILTATALFTQTWVLYCNRVGFEDGIAFGGESRVIDPSGETVAMLEGLDAGELDFRLDAARLQRARVETPLLRDEKPWLVLGELEARLLTLHPDDGEEDGDDDA